MPNRVRLVVASFLTKDLGIDWRLGERWFMRWLIDGDVANNNGNWRGSRASASTARRRRAALQPERQMRALRPGRRLRRALDPGARHG